MSSAISQLMHKFWGQSTQADEQTNSRQQNLSSTLSQFKIKKKSVQEAQKKLYSVIERHIEKNGTQPFANSNIVVTEQKHRLKSAVVKSKL